MSVEDIIKMFIKSKVCTRWPFDSKIIEKALEECNYLPNKTEEHLMYAIENNIDPLVAVRENKTVKLKEPLYMDVEKLKDKAIKLKNSVVSIKKYKIIQLK